MKTTTLIIGLTLAVTAGTHGQCIQGDINGDGTVNGIDLAYVLQNWGQSCPAVIQQVSPSSGLQIGGTAITITGEQLGGVLSVTIGGVPATNVVGVNATTITAVTPPSKLLGPVDVVVTTSASSATLVGGFIYSTLDWATVIEISPDPAVVTDPEWRERIIATGLPWRVRDNASQIEMLLVPPGTFMMGCSPSDQYGCDSDENPVHEVTLTQPFYLGRYEVTQAQWTVVMGTNPSNFQGFPDSPMRPVDQVSWPAIQAFEDATSLRLPTEAEWEYACRGGTTTAFSNGSNDDATVGQIAWFGPNANSQSRPVGLKQANALGIHDMLGNAWEFVEDWYGSYPDSSQVDPTGPTAGTVLTLRGGSWDDPSVNCRVSAREGYNGGGFAARGLRVARNP